MIRVMIAEDEAAIRRGLIHCIRWDELGLELAAEAENGRQALDFLIASPVDILITDMRSSSARLRNARSTVRSSC